MAGGVLLGTQPRHLLRELARLPCVQLAKRLPVVAGSAIVQSSARHHPVRGAMSPTCQPDTDACRCLCSAGLCGRGGGSAPAQALRQAVAIRGGQPPRQQQLRNRLRLPACHLLPQ